MESLKIFKSDDFGNIRIIEQDGKVLFCGRDIAAALGYTNPNKALADHCKGVPIRYPLQTPGGIQDVRFITEGDVYRLITHSRLPAAEQFERWVFDEVLPSIRKTGAYGIPPERLADLNSYQARLDKNRRLLADFEQYTAAACREAHEARKRYDELRGMREEIRKNVQFWEERIAHEIRTLKEVN